MKAFIEVKRGNRSYEYALFSSRSSDLELYEENREKLEATGMVLIDGALYGSKTGINAFKTLRRNRKTFAEAACPECGSTNVVVRMQIKNLLCNDCGRISYTVRGGVKVSSLYTQNR